ncbi:MAG: ATP-dependent Clp protease adaptor ClpS [Chlorobi bacterium]|nr:ATP-dependent Clp protease adaptor ClpS [Chlorobiota bacterium]
MFDRLRKQLSRLRGFFGTIAEANSPAKTAVLPGSTIIESPDKDVMVAEDTLIGFPAKVILYNDEIHTFDEVIHQLMKAIDCPPSEAEQIAMEVDSRGLASVFEGELDRCLRVSSVLEEIALHTSIES